MFFGNKTYFFFFCKLVNVSPRSQLHWRIDHTIGNDILWREHWYWRPSKLAPCHSNLTTSRRWSTLKFPPAGRLPKTPSKKSRSYRKSHIWNLLHAKTLKFIWINISDAPYIGAKQFRRLFFQSVVAVRNWEPKLSVDINYQCMVFSCYFHKLNKRQWFLIMASGGTASSNPKGSSLTETAIMSLSLAEKLSTMFTHSPFQD